MMRAVKKLYLLILCCCLSTAYGQDRTLRFFDLQTRLPIADVHVTSSHRIFVSDSSGTVQVPANAAIIEVSHVQYEPRTIDLKTVASTAFLSDRTTEPTARNTPQYNTGKPTTHPRT